MLYFLSPKLNFDFTKKYNLFLQRKKNEIPCRRPTFRAVSRNFFFNVCCCDDAHGQVLLAYKMCINVRSGVSADPIIHA